jgi:DNA-binding transcriptional LysR family regulator
MEACDPVRSVKRQPISPRFAWPLNQLRGEEWISTILCWGTLAAAALYRSFSKAADGFGVSCGVVSKATARLGRHISTRLLYWITRSVMLTDVAQHYYCSYRRLLEELDEVNREITRDRELAGGRLRIVAHSMLIGAPFARPVWSFSDACPGVNLAVSFRRDDTIDLFDGQYDIALVPHDHVAQSTAIRRTLTKSKKIFVAARAYLASRAAPNHCADLSGHEVLLDPLLRQRGTDLIAIIEGRRLETVIALFARRQRRAAALCRIGRRRHRGHSRCDGARRRRVWTAACLRIFYLTCAAAFDLHLPLDRTLPR